MYALSGIMPAMAEDSSLSEATEQPRTVELPAIPQWAIELQTSLRGGFTAVNSRLDSLEGANRNVSDEVSRLRREVVDIRSEHVRHDEDIKRLSLRTKGTDARTSENDLEQIAQLAQERAAREALANAHAATDAKVEALASAHATTAEKVNETATQVTDIAKTNEAQLAILSRLDRVASNPTVKFIVGMLATALVTWLASHGIRISTQ